jgi:hypothetical protein
MNESTRGLHEAVLKIGPQTRAYLFGMVESLDTNILLVCVSFLRIRGVSNVFMRCRK